MTTSADGSTTPSLTHDEVVRVCGDILDWKVTAIINTGAILSELEVANAWASGEDEVLGEEREPLSGTIAEIYDIILADEEFDEEK